VSKPQEIEPLSIRCPREIKEWVEREAANNFRSQNQQVLAILKDRMDAQEREKAVR
jgi:hypothetical protein